MTDKKAPESVSEYMERTHDTFAHDLAASAGESGAGALAGKLKEDYSAMKPCPFCGNEVAEIARDASLKVCYVICKAGKGGCGANAAYCETEAEAIAAWQKRVGWDEDR